MSTAGWWEFLRWAGGLLALNAVLHYGLRFLLGWLLRRAGKACPEA